MRRIALLAFVSIAINLHAQTATPSDTSYWRFGGITSANFSQVSLNNWAAGGNNSLSFGGYINLFLIYEKQGTLFRTNLETGYGVIKQGFNVSPTKTDDFIILNSQYSKQLGTSKNYLSTMFDFRTQYYEGEDENGRRISDWFAPAYILTSLGIERKVNDNFGVFLAPVTGKFTFVTDPLLAAQGAFGVKPGVIDPNTNEIIEDGETSRSEIGFLFRALYAKNELIKNVGLVSKFELFGNYETLTRMDINWQNTIAMKVNSFLAVNFNTQLIYDDDIDIIETDEQGNEENLGAKVQFKSVLGVGLTYKFGAKKPE